MAASFLHLRARFCIKTPVCASLRPYWQPHARFLYLHGRFQEQNKQKMRFSRAHVVVVAQLERGNRRH